MKLLNTATYFIVLAWAIAAMTVPASVTSAAEPALRTVPRYDAIPEAISPACDLGNQLLADLADDGHQGLLILSEQPADGRWIVSTKNVRGARPRPPTPLIRAWKRSQPSNLLVACPTLKANLPATFRMARPEDDVATYGSQTSIRYFGSPTFNATATEALVVAGFSCSGRCGGYEVRYYRRTSGRWKLLTVLTSIYG